MARFSINNLRQGNVDLIPGVWRQRRRNRGFLPPDHSRRDGTGGTGTNNDGVRVSGSKTLLSRVSEQQKLVEERIFTESKGYIQKV